MFNKIVMFCSQISQDQIGYYVPYYLYFLFSSICGSLIYLHMPETEGKTLEEIQSEICLPSETKFKVKKRKMSGD